MYIKLSENGKAATCLKAKRDLFEYSKARNIVDNLPKNLQKLKFRVEAVPDIKPCCISNQPAINKKVIKKEHYVLPEKISYWIKQFGICDEILKEAERRKDELNKELSNLDKEFINIIHEIELEGKIDLYGGWIERNRIKRNREKRRDIKDELIIISNVLKVDYKNLKRENIRNAVKGLSKRKFTFRIIEEEASDDMQNVQ